MIVFEIRNKMTGMFLANKEMKILQFGFQEEATAYLKKCGYNLEVFKIEQREIEE